MDDDEALRSGSVWERGEGREDGLWCAGYGVLCIRCGEGLEVVRPSPHSSSRANPKSRRTTPANQVCSPASPSALAPTLHWRELTHRRVLPAQRRHLRLGSEEDLDRIETKVWVAVLGVLARGDTATRRMEEFEELARERTEGRSLRFSRG